MGSITELVRELRKKATPEEKKLWERLRGRKLMGKKFLRQQPIIYDTIPKQQFFVADFYCAEAKLVVEVDGKYHVFRKDYDQNRDEILNQLELRVLRFKNEELQDIDKVLGKIGKFL